MSGGLTSAISKEGTSVSDIPESNNKDTSQREVTTCQYAEIGFASPHPTAPPTSDNVPVQYSVICGHLNTMVILNVLVIVIISDIIYRYQKTRLNLELMLICHSHLWSKIMRVILSL